MELHQLPIHPKAIEHWEEGNRIDEEEHDVHRAELMYELALTVDPRHANSWVNLGELAYRVRDVDRALECFRIAYKLDDDCAAAKYNLGFLEFSRGDDEKALDLFYETLIKDPTHYGALYNAALIHHKLGDACAQFHARRFLKLYPNDQDADEMRKIVGITNLATLNQYKKKKKYGNKDKQAVTEYRKEPA